MTLDKFIELNREELDACIRNAVSNPEFKIDDEERRLWVLNDEGLYHWARSEGVREDDEDEDNTNEEEI